MGCARIAGSRGGRSVKLPLSVRAAEEFSSIGSHDHLVSRIGILGNVGPAFLPRAPQ